MKRSANFRSYLRWSYPDLLDFNNDFFISLSTIDEHYNELRLISRVSNILYFLLDFFLLLIISENSFLILF